MEMQHRDQAALLGGCRVPHQPWPRLLDISHLCSKSSTWWEGEKIHSNSPRAPLLPFFTDRKFAHIVAWDHSTGKTEEPDTHLSCSFFSAAAKDNDVCVKRVYRYCSQPSSEVACSRATGQLITTKTFTHPSYFTWLCHSKQDRAGSSPVYPRAPNTAPGGGKQERKGPYNVIPHIIFGCWCIYMQIAASCMLRRSW